MSWAKLATISQAWNICPWYSTAGYISTLDNLCLIELGCQAIEWASDGSVPNERILTGLLLFWSESLVNHSWNIEDTYPIVKISNARGISVGGIAFISHRKAFSSAPRSCATDWSNPPLWPLFPLLEKRFGPAHLLFRGGSLELQVEWMSMWILIVKGCGMGGWDRGGYMLPILTEFPRFDTSPTS